jgi:hypothetical protein
MSERSQLQITTWIAIGGFLLTVASFFYSVYKDNKNSEDVRALQKINQLKDSIEHAKKVKADSIKEHKEYLELTSKYDHEAEDLVSQNKRTSGEHCQNLTFINYSAKPITIAITYQGCSKIWFTEGFYILDANEKMGMPHIDTTANLYVYIDNPYPELLLNKEKIETLESTNQYADTTGVAFTYFGERSPPHKTVVLLKYYRVNMQFGHEIYFSNPEE